MKTSPIFTHLIILISFLIVGCESDTPSVISQIPSLRKNYPFLLQEAQKWRPDADLKNASIFLFPSSPESNLISTVFYSPSEDSESISIDLHKNGTVTTKVFTHQYPVDHRALIAVSDWQVDSQEALDNLLHKSGQQLINADRYSCSFVRLERVPIESNPVIWSLTLWDCYDDVKHFYLDANSGETVDSSLVNIKPTRFPTLTPLSP